jgi:hypothetical protein
MSVPVAPIQTSEKTPPDTTEIKTVFQDAIKYGAAQKIARYLGISHSVVSDRFNRNNDKKLYIAEAAREFWAIASADPEAYQVVKTYFVMLLDSWAESIPTTDKSLSGLVGEAAEKLNDLQRARFIDGGSPKVQREETLAIISALQQFLTGLGKQMELRNESQVTPMKRRM